MSELEIVGRDAEMQAISLFLERPVRPGALLIEGGPGIGKTTLWRWGVERATERGWHVLAARPTAPEEPLGFAALGDLLGGGVEAVASRLPPPQKHALGVALLLEEPGRRAPDVRTVAVAVLGALRELARERPLLLAVDDVQWLDRPSAEALSFVTRRLGDAPVALLVAQRRNEKDGIPLGLDDAFAERLELVSPRQLSLGGTHRLLRIHLALTLSRPSLRRVHAACGGNPLFALEIGRVLRERPDAIRADDPLPVPEDVARLLAHRIERLGEAGREAVLAAALQAQPSASVVECATDRKGVDEATRAGVLVADSDGLRFAHPLFAEAAVSLAPETRRREMHLRLAAVLDHPEERARHLAFGSSAPAADIAAEVERGADTARGRGATASAAALAEHAARLTPPDDLEAVARRTTTAANWWMDAGDTRRSLSLVEPLLTRLPPGVLRAEALYAKARADSDRASYRRLLEEAVAESEGYPNRQVLPLLGLAHALVHAAEFGAARKQAHIAVSCAEQAEDPASIALALSLVGRLSVGAGGLPPLRRAHELESQTVGFDAYESSATWLGWWLATNDEFDAARQLLVEQLRRAGDAGDEWSRTWLHWPLTELECRAGNYDAARAYADEGAELAEQSDNPYALWISPYSRALVAAHTGDASNARAFAEDSLTKAQAIHGELFAVRPRITLGLLAVSEERYTDARVHLEGAIDLAVRGPYWVTYPFLGDLFEALVALGDLDRTRSVLATIDEHGLAAERPSLAPALIRCRGLIECAAGSFAEGIASFEEALLLQDAHSAPLERGRTLLVLGAAQRRARRRRLARETLQEALGIFDELGAQTWCRRAQVEVSRIGGRAPAADGLTPSEQRIADLVAEGKTNKEVAAILVVTNRTVESALTQIYRKLDVRSRTELSRKLAGEPGPVSR